MGTDKVEIHQAARWHRLKAEQVFMDAQLTFVRTDLSSQEFTTRFPMKARALTVNQGLPVNLHLLTLERRNTLSQVKTDIASLLIRLEHLFDIGEDGDYSRPSRWIWAVSSQIWK